MVVSVEKTTLKIIFVTRRLFLNSSIPRQILTDTFHAFTIQITIPIHYIICMVVQIRYKTGCRITIGKHQRDIVL